MPIESITEVQALFNHWNWDLQERSCIETIGELGEPTYLWTIELTREQWDTVYYTVDIPIRDVHFIENVNESVSTEQEHEYTNIHIRLPKKK